MALPEQDIERLEELLFSDTLEDEALDYFGVHGLVCASVVGPVNLPDESIFSLIFGAECPKFSDEDEGYEFEKYPGNQKIKKSKKKT